MDAHRRKEALLKDLNYAFQHPGEFFKAFGHEYVVEYQKFVQAMNSGTVSGDFTTGKIVGELVLDILAVIGVGEAAAKWAGKILELARIAKTLTKPVKVLKPLTEGGAAVDAGEETSTATKTAKGVAEKSTSDRTQAIRNSLLRQNLGSEWFDEAGKFTMAG